MKLRHKVSLLTFLVGGAVLLSTLLVHEYISHRSAINETHQYMAALAKEISFHIDTFLKEKTSKAKTLASTPLLIDALRGDNQKFAQLSPSERTTKIERLNQRWLASENLSDPFVQSYLNNPIASFLQEQRALLPGEYGEIFLTNQYGSVIASTGKLTTFAHAHKHWWKASYNEGQGKTFIDDRGFDESMQGYALGIVVPVWSGEDIVGILKCNLNVRESLSQLSHNFSLEGKDSYLRIVRSKGQVLIHKDKEPLSTSVSDDLIAQMSVSDNSSLIVLGKDGKEHLVAYSVVPSTLGVSGIDFGGTQHTIDQSRGNSGESWYAVACTSKEQIVALLHKTDNIQTFVGVITVLMLAAIAFMFGGIIGRPVAKFSEVAEKIGRGDLDVKIDASDDSDIGKAANAINQMAVNLKKTQDARDKLMQNRMRSAQLEVLGTVAAGVAHEINNPIQGIMNYATLIGNDSGENARIKDYARRIVHETDRVAKITQNLLFYSRESNPEVSNVDVAELINNALSLIEKKLLKSGIRVEVTLPDDVPEMKLFPQLFQQAVLNLVDNAYDALRHKDFTADVPELKISGQISGDFFKLEIEDNGEGIAKDILDKIKAPFFTTKPSSEGTGLGLSIVEEIIAKHKGTLNFKSVFGQFTVVTIRLPLN